MRKTVLTLLLGVALGAAVVAAPALSSSSSDKSAKRFLTVRAGDYVTFRGFDFACTVNRTDADGYESGPLVYCNRPSANFNARGVGWSRYHVYETTRRGAYRINVVPRTP